MLYHTSYYFYFLLITLTIYWVILRTPRARANFLGLASAGLVYRELFESAGHAAASYSFLIALLVGLLVYACGRRLARSGWSPLFWLYVPIPLSPLVMFKYLLPGLGDSGSLASLAVPLGISYYTFKHIHYLIESSRGNFSDATPGSYLAYVFFFPMFGSGPIERYGNFQGQLLKPELKWSGFSIGIERICLGLVKKFLVADILLRSMLPPGHLSGSGIGYLDWKVLTFACFIKFLVTYMDFSGYTDMVIGTGRLYGITLMENFNFPLVRTNLAEFWRNWHISLSSWARDYIYFPVMGRFRTPSLALVLTMLMIGVWHGPQPGWALWGLHHGIGLVLLSRYHRWSRGKAGINRLKAAAWWKVVSILFVWWYVSLGYALTFNAASLGGSLAVYLKVLTFGVTG
jgi:alginate O-acetyltransferase complex protein AlgI